MISIPLDRGCLAAFKGSFEILISSEGTVLVLTTSLYSSPSPTVYTVSILGRSTICSPNLKSSEISTITTEN